MLSSVGLSLELSRAEIAERGVHPRSVVPEQPVERGVFGLSLAVELHAMQSFDLQRTEQRLRAGVVPAVALATHGSFYPMLGKKLGVAMAGILAATVAVEDQSGSGPSAVPRHVDRAAGQPCRDRRAHRPAHDAAAEQVQHHGQVQPPFAGGDRSCRRPRRCSPQGR